MHRYNLNLPWTFVGVAEMAGIAVLVTEDAAATRTATECIAVVFVVLLEAAENNLLRNVDSKCRRRWRSSSE